MVEFYRLRPHCFIAEDADGLHLYEVIWRNGVAIGCRYWGLVDNRQRWEAIGAAEPPSDMPPDTLARWMRASRLHDTIIAPSPNAART